jgi:uroporphyrinogen-III synthase
MDWFGGLKVLSLETRRGPEMATLIVNYGGVATAVPSMREDKQDISERLEACVQRVKAHPEQQVLVCMTGIGTRLFLQDLEKYDPGVYAQLQDARLLSRGTKPTQALKALGFTPVTAARPHTYREVQDSLRDMELRGQDVTPFWNTATRPPHP